MSSSQYSSPHTKNWTEISIDSNVSVNSLNRALIQLKKSMNETTEKLNQTGLKWVQNFAVDVTLDPDTANPHLILSADGKQVSHGDTEQDVPKNPKRFKDPCVLAKEGFSSGRFYYEVQVKGKTQWVFGVASESIDRKEEIGPSTGNGLCILAFLADIYVVNDNPPVGLFQNAKSERFGVFVDYEEGLVSFYDVDSGSHIYSLTGQKFTDKLYPYFSPGNNEGENPNPLIITPIFYNKQIPPREI